MAADVGRERTVPLAEPRDHRLPTGAAVGEAVQQHEHGCVLHTSHHDRDRHRQLPGDPRNARRVRALRDAARLHLPGLAQHADRALDRREQRLRAWSHIDERSAGFFALGAAKASGAAGGGHLHLRHRGRESAARGDRGARGRGAADRADRRPPARAARRRRRPDDRPDQALRRRREVVRRARRPRCRRRAAALGAQPRLPRLLDGGQRTPRARCTSTSRCASRWCSTSRCPRTSPAAAAGRTGSHGCSRRHPRRRTPAALPRRHEFSRTVFVAGDLGPNPELGRRLADVRGSRPGPAARRPAVGSAQRTGRDRALRPAAPRPRPGRSSSRPTSSAGSATFRPQSRCATWIAGLEQAQHVLFAPDERWSDPSARVAQRIVGSLEDLLERGDARRGGR